MKRNMPAGFHAISKVGFRRGLQLGRGLVLLLTVWTSGCHVVKKTAEVPGRAVTAVTGGGKQKATVDPVEMQQVLLQLADEFSTRMYLDVDKLRRGTNALDPAEVLQWK